MPSPFTCGLEAVLFVLGGKWKPLIVHHLAQGTLRYGALRRAVGKVSDKVLAQQVKELIADGVVLRRDFAEIPPKVEYELTPFGRSLAAALLHLCAWGERHEAELAAVLERREPRGMGVDRAAPAAPPITATGETGRAARQGKGSGAG